MKKLLAVLTALVLMMTFALAEELSLTEGMVISLPGDVRTEMVEDVVTCVRGQTRAVLQVLPQQMKEDPLSQLQELMLIFDPAVSLVKTEATLPGGPALAWGTIENSFGEGLHQYVAMVLTEEKLLSLSSYHLEGDNQAAQNFLAELLGLIRVNGEALLPGA